MEILTEFSWVDVLILALLGLALFLGFAQGIVRYLLNALAVFVAFIVAAQLKGPISDFFAVWTAFPPEGRELIFFIILFIGFVVGLWFLIRAAASQTRMPVTKLLDEIGGAIFGLAFAVIFICFHLVVLDSFYRGTPNEATGALGSYYNAMNDSLIVRYLRETVVPAIGFVARPFVPREIAELLVR